MQENLTQLFNITTQRFKDRIAIQYQQENAWKHLTYQDLKIGVEGLAHFFVSQGVQPSDRVVLMFGNQPYWPMAFFSVVSVGAVVVPVNPQASEQEVDQILKDAKPALALVQGQSALLSEKKARQYCLINRVIDVDASAFSLLLERSQGAQPCLRPQGQDTTACLLYTSGTTGEAKAVMLSHHNFISNCQSLYQTKIIQDNDRVVAVLPLHHAYPLTITMLLPLLYGACVVYPKSLKNDDIANAMQQANPTVFVVVPQILHNLHQKIYEQLNHLFFPIRLILSGLIHLCDMIRRSTGLNLARHVFYFLHQKFGRSMRLFASGGARLSAQVQRDLFKLGFTISEGYGLSETSPVLTFNPVKRPKPGSVGVAIPHVELKIDQPDEKGIGEVVARGPNIMQGYYHREDLTNAVIKDGWFFTGDLGSLDRDGYLFISGRSKELIVLSSGLNIDPKEIEQAYMKSVPITEICVFDMPTPQSGQTDVVLWAVVRPDLDFFKKHGEVNLKHVIKERFDNVSKQLPAHQRLMGFFITLDELPKTALGKLKRFEVKKVYGPQALQDREALPRQRESKLSDLDKEMAGSVVGQQIVRYLTKKCSMDRDILVADSLELDLGIDSLGRIELLSALEALFGQQINDEVVGRSFTVRDLIVETETFLTQSHCSIDTNKQNVEIDDHYWTTLFKTPPSQKNIDQIDLKPGLFARLTGLLFLFPFFVFFKMLYRLQVEGAENLAQSKRHIFYANHVSYFDGLAAGVSFPNFPRLDMFFIGFRPYFNVVIIRDLIKIGRIIPVDFSAHLTEALRSCYYILSHDKNLFIFPEGVRSLDGEIGDFKKGFGILAKESKAKLVPVFLQGFYEAWPRTARFPKRHPLKVIFGKAQDVDELVRRGERAGIADPYEAICFSAKEVLKDLAQKS